MYDLRGLGDDPNKCPECGAAFDPDKPRSFLAALDASRGLRRRGWGCVAVLGTLQAIPLSLSGGAWLIGRWKLGYPPSTYRDRPWEDSVGPIAAWMIERLEYPMLGYYLVWVVSVVTMAVFLLVAAGRLADPPGPRDRLVAIPALLLLFLSMTPFFLGCLDWDPLWWWD